MLLFPAKASLSALFSVNLAFTIIGALSDVRSSSLTCDFRPEAHSAAPEPQLSFQSQLTVCTCLNRYHSAHVDDRRLQLILTSRLLINLREASEEDIYIGSRQVSDEDEDGWPSFTMSEFSTLNFSGTEGRASHLSDQQTSGQSTFAGFDTYRLDIYNV